MFNIINVQFIIYHIIRLLLKIYKHNSNVQKKNNNYIFKNEHIILNDIH